MSKETKKQKKPFSYENVRIVCNGKIKGCDFCREITEIQEGYCSMCSRPLWKRPGEKCGFILGYHDKNMELKGFVAIQCKFCNTMTTLSMEE